MIEINNLVKKYGDFTALNDINLTINDGEIFGIIGLSGAGKSTLVRCINYLEKPTSGDVIIDGEKMSGLSKKDLLKKRRSIGMIFQSFNLLEQRTILKNVMFPLEITGMKKNLAEKRAKEYLETVGLGDKINSYPSELSGGQKQRAAIARAIVSENTRYLLCDEATSALDPDTTRQILSLIQKVNKEFNVTVIVITHEMKVIESICHRVAVLDKSTVAEMGNVSEIFASPKSDIAKKLIHPDLVLPETVSDGAKFRIIYSGESSSRPILSQMILETKTPVNILKANTRELENKAYGDMIIEANKEDSEKISNYLKVSGIRFEVIG